MRRMCAPELNTLVVVAVQGRIQVADGWARVTMKNSVAIPKSIGPMDRRIDQPAD